MKIDVFSTPGRSLRRFTVIGLGLLAGVLVFGGGCGRDRSGRPDTTQGRVNVVMGERLGATVAEAVEPGEVVLVHLSSAPGQAEQWARGLRDGLGGGGFSVTVMGPDLHPNASQYGIGGNPPLQYALEQYPDAAAIVTTLPVGAYERPSFAKGHPPIYALDWAFLPDSAHMFQSGGLVAGVFARADWDPSAMGDASLSPDEMFDRSYVVATPKNFRELASKF